jgi:hypothetical protein
LEKNSRSRNAGRLAEAGQAIAGAQGRREWVKAQGSVTDPCKNFHASPSLFLEAGDQGFALEVAWPAGVENVNKSLFVKSRAMKHFAP